MLTITEMLVNKAFIKHLLKLENTGLATKERVKN